jgi:hypothetical protein
MVVLLSAIPTQIYAPAYSIPLLGRWADLMITVSIPHTPMQVMNQGQENDWAYFAVENATLVWNQAQEWFVSKYYPQEKTYKFTIAKHAAVTVSFTDLKTPNNYTMTGQTLFNETSAGFYRSSVVILRWPTDRFSGQQPYQLYIVALHQFGHVLGLGNTNLGYALDGSKITDLIDASQSIGLTPLTLDLYAVHLLASGITAPNAVLPSNIPLTNAPSTSTNSIPELTSFLPALLLTIIAAAVVGRGRHGKRDHSIDRNFSPSVRETLSH